MGFDICMLSDSFLGCGRKVCGWICFFLLLGPALIIVAIVMFVLAAKDPRDHHIDTYNTAVESWVGGKYALFRNQNLSFEIFDEFDQWNEMEKNTEVDEVNDSGKNIRKYSEYIKYQYDGYILHTPVTTDSDTVSVTNLDSGEGMEVGVKSYIDTWYTASELGCTHSCSSSSYSNCDSTATCQSYCFDKNGYWDPIWDYCYVVKYAQEVCIKVKDDGSFDHNDPLCYEEVYGDWQPDPVGATGGVRNIPQITVTIRATSDPFIVLFKLTGGSLSFGLTSKQYVEIGIVFMAVGGFLCIFIALLFVLACWMGHCACFNNQPYKSKFISSR